MPHWVGMMWMVLDVASCGALLYPGAGSWNAETCGHSDSDRSQKTVGMLLLVPPSMYTYTSLQCQKPSFVSLIPTYLLCCRPYRCELWMCPTSSLNAYKSYYRDLWLCFSLSWIRIIQSWLLCFIRAVSRRDDVLRLSHDMREPCSSLNTLGSHSGSSHWKLSE